jgi:hypothetical protein
MTDPGNNFFDDAGPEDEPLGQRFRQFVDKAFADPRRKEIQLDKLDRILGIVADRLPGSLQAECKQFFNFAAAVGQSSEEKKLSFIIDAVTLSGGNGTPGSFSPLRKIPLQMSTLHTEFTRADILALPNYIRLHSLARDMDVAIKMVAATIDDAQTANIGMPVLIIDLTKSYDAGGAEPDSFYPALPPRKIQRKPGGDFKIE